MRKVKVIYILLFCFCCFLVYPQQKIDAPVENNYGELGLPFIQNYTVDDYNAGTQNWTAVQGQEGIMYFGNYYGVLEYDGVRWRLISLPNKGAVKSLASDKSGKIYVGGYNEIGYLEPDSSGTLEFVSLKKHLDPIHHDFQSIWSISILEDEVYFQSVKKLFKWKNGKFKIIGTDSKFDISKIINQELYVVESGQLIKKLVNDSLVPVVDASSLNGARVIDFIRHKNDEWMLLTIRKGYFITNQNALTPVKGFVSDYLAENISYWVKMLSNGWYVFATITGGMVVVDHDGELIWILDKTDGIVDNNITFLYEDNQKGLWVCTNNGISRVEVLSPSTYYDEKLGAEGYINKLYRHNEKLYMSNTYGISILKKDENRPVRYSFKSFDGVKTYQGLEFMSMGDTLFTTSRSHLDLIVNNKSIKKFPYKSGSLTRSKINPNLIYVGLMDGLAFLTYQNNEWTDGGRINGITDDIHKIVEEQNGDLWLQSSIDGVWKVNVTKALKEDDFHNPEIRHYRPNIELPDAQVFLHYMRGETWFDIDSKIFKYDKEFDSIIPNNELAELFGLEGKMSPKIEDKNGDIWLYSQNKTEDPIRLLKAAKQIDGSFQIKKIHNERFDDMRSTLLPELNGVIWNGGPSGIVRHDLNVSKDYEKDFYTIVRRISVSNDSIIFGGAAVKNVQYTLPFSKNQFRFEFAAPSFDDESKNLFQFYLDGFDKGWSAWTKETQKDYTNIPEGNYTFKVRAKNIYGQIGKEDGYSFTVLPPWYRTWWAYLGYTLMCGLAIWGYAQWRSQQLRNKNLALEALVDERTEEIREKNKLLGHQTERLKEMDTMKTRLFANISHEFRTPLTLIKGPIEKLESAGENKISTPNIKMIRRNSNRLLNLVNQLLDLSKLDSGKLKLNAAEGDVFKCIRAAASAFSSHAASRQMDYQIKISPRLLWTSFDRDKFEKIIYNLLSNAFKFTADEGRVIIAAEFRSDRVKIKVSDTGGGIASDKLPHIFDRFFQVDDSYTKEKSGSGIGLALTKELVELMGGTIFVESEMGKGTLFRVGIPLEEIQSGKSHEKVEEVPTTIITVDSEQSSATTFKSKAVKILIIEDNNDMRHFIREQLEADYDVLEAVNGKEGLKLATKMMPDLIVTDLMMPQMDGITLCKKLKTDLATSHIPVIMLTAKAGIENKLEGLETGADDYLTKPFNAKELQTRTKNLIASRQHLRELFSRNISLDPKEITVTSLDEKFLQQVLTLLEQKYSDSEFGVPQMQKELGMSKTSLHSKIKALTTHPPGELLRTFRLQRAKQLLTQRADNISQVAYDVGFNSLSYFTRCFKEYYGTSPSEFLKNKT